MIQKFLLGVAGMVMLTAPGWLLAVGDDFTISTVIGIDTVAPTTPAFSTVVPIASTQIDVTWSAATDDIAVAGYRLFRDSVQIATTTLLSYSDTGLTPSTTYQYTVDAFDTAFNFSSTSAVVSTTTLDIVVPPTPSSTAPSQANGGTRTAPHLVSLVVSANERNALFTWETNIPTQYVLVWGRTTEYELGSVSGGAYKQNHSTLIDALEPGTIYYYALRSINVRGQLTVVSTASFMTKSTLTADSLPNVQNFTAQADGTDVGLSWVNTFSNPDYYVRVVRSHLFYPSTVQSGAVVYEGRGSSFVDKEALAIRSPQYYTIFVLNGAGAVSSGAVAKVSKIDLSEPDVPVGTSTFPLDIGDDSILSAADILIIQNEHTYRFDQELNLMKGASYLISVPYDSVARNLKSIIVSVQNPTNQREVSAYLLKLNQAGDAYTAYIPGANVVGTAGIIVEVFDYEQETVRRISTLITFIDETQAIPFFPDRLLLYFPYYTLMFFSTLFLIFLFFILRRRQHQEKTY